MQDHYLMRDSYWQLVDKLIAAENEFWLSKRDVIIYALADVNIFSEEWRDSELSGPDTSAQLTNNPTSQGEAAQ